MPHQHPLRAALLREQPHDCSVGVTQQFLEIGPLKRLAQVGERLLTPPLQFIAEWARCLARFHDGVFIFTEAFQQNIEVAHHAQIAREWLKLFAQSCHTFAPKRGRRLQQTRHRAQPTARHTHLMDVFDAALFGHRCDTVANTQQLRAQGFASNTPERLFAEGRFLACRLWRRDTPPCVC